MKMMSGIALRGALEGTVLPAFEAESGISVEVLWEPTTVIMKALADGAAADLVILTDEAIGKLVTQDIAEQDSVTPLADAVLGVAVAPGAPRPDIGTASSFRQALLDARSVAYSRAGASGIYFEKLIERLGIAETVRARATVIPAGFTAERLVAGEADLAIQQLSELMMVPGVDILGPFPPELQSATRFQAALLRASSQADGVRRLLHALNSDVARSAYRDSGLVPAVDAERSGAGA